MNVLSCAHFELHDSKELFEHFTLSKQYYSLVYCYALHRITPITEVIQYKIQFYSKIVIDKLVYKLKFNFASY